MPKKVCKDKQQEILDWLSQHKIDCSCAKLHRYFSNGVALATLLKDLYPRLVEMHNYPAQNSLRLKLENLETLNAKVLSKLGIQQKLSTLEDIANGKEGAIESVLYQIMFLEQEELKRKDSVMGQCEDLKNIILNDEQVLEITVNKKIGDALVKVPQQMVLYSLYERTVKNVEKKREQLKLLEMRLFQAENELEQRRAEVEKLIRYEEAREYRKRLYGGHQSANSSNRLHIDSPKSTKGTKQSSHGQKSQSSPRNNKDSPRSKDDAKLKVCTASVQKGLETSSTASRKYYKSLRIPMHMPNTK